MSVRFDSVLSSERLPSLPVVAIRIIELAQAADPEFPEMVRVIKADPAVSAKILKTVNSAIFGFGKRVSSIEAAVPILGANLVRTVVLSFSLARYQSPDQAFEKSYQRHWRRSVIQAVTAEALACKTGCGDPAVFFIAGLLQDIGELALLSTLQHEYPAEDFWDDPDGQCAAEVSHLSFSHVDVGAELGRRWGLDEHLLAAISRHHHVFDPAAHDAWSPLETASAMAVAFVEYVDAPRLAAMTYRTSLFELAKIAFGFTPSDVNELLFDVPLRVGEVSSVFAIDIGEIPTREEILARSNAMLESLAIESQVQAMAAKQQAELATSKLTRLEDQREQWRDEANRDPLTGAYNRRFMDTALRTKMQQCSERGSSLGLLFADLDNFKHLNDTFGHAVGDAALAEVSRVLHDSIRETDIVIRYGGDEFLVILVNVDFARLQQISLRVCERIRQTALDRAAQGSLTVSLGGVFHAPTAGRAMASQDLFREVDDAMYEAKQLGGDQACLREFSTDCVMSGE